MNSEYEGAKIASSCRKEDISNDTLICFEQNGQSVSLYLCELIQLLNGVGLHIGYEQVVSESHDLLFKNLQ